MAVGIVAKALGNLATKRVRPWEFCDDVQELKRMLAEKDNEVAHLQRKLILAEEQQPASSPAEDANPLPLKSLKAIQAQAAKVKRSIQAQVSSQIAYNHTARDGVATLNPVEVLDVTESVLESLVGEKHFKQAPHHYKQGLSAPEQVKIVLLNEEMEDVFKKSFSKKLRFGARLELSYGLTFLFSKSKGSLKVCGGYKMVK